MRDTELFRDVAQYIRDNPEEYDQNFWSYYDEDSCGTYRCILGTGIHLRGIAKQCFDLSEGGEVTFKIGYLPFVDGAHLFGISPTEANFLFHGAWRPAHGLSVPEALEKLAAGAHLKDVTDVSSTAYFELLEDLVSQESTAF